MCTSHYLEYFDRLLISCNPCSSKAVANGTILYYLDRSVASRVSKASYGSSSCVPFDSQNLEHQKRSLLAYIKPLSRKRVLGGKFDCIIEKVRSAVYYLYCEPTSMLTLSRSRELLSKKVIRSASHTTWKQIGKGISLVSVQNSLAMTEIYRFLIGMRTTKACLLIVSDRYYNSSKLMFFELDKIHKLCDLSADLSELFTEKRLISPSGGTYVNAHFKVELQFGTTELQAKITWIGKDVSR